MRFRTFGRTGWQISEIGYGMWGMGGWTGSDDEESLQSLQRAVALGCNFFDTAWAYGQGHSERLLGETLQQHKAGVRAPSGHMPIIVATKVPPKNLTWPGKAETPIAEVFPPDHIREFTEKSLKNLGVDAIDVQQLHVWSDAWADDPGWQRAVRTLKDERLVRAFGISVNRWEPANVLRALDTGLVDSVQVVYNIFDQAPEDKLFPYCQERGIAVIARVPFDEGSLTGALTPGSTWPDGDFRNVYFKAPNLADTLERIERLRPLVPEGMDLPELALRFILHHPAVSTSTPLPRRLLDALRAHRWDRTAEIP